MSSRFCREQLRPKERFAAFRYVKVGKRGHEILVGCPVGEWDPTTRRCSVPMQAKAILHPISEGKCPAGKSEFKREGYPLKGYQMDRQQAVRRLSYLKRQLRSTLKTSPEEISHLKREIAKLRQEVHLEALPFAPQRQFVMDKINQWRKSWWFWPAVAGGGLVIIGGIYMIASGGATGDVLVDHNDQGALRVRYPNGDIKIGFWSKGAKSASWLANNPGNITYSDQAWKSLGAFKGVWLPWGNYKFAIFPTEDDGFDAISKLLKSSLYQSGSISQAIGHWAPATDPDNNTTAYANAVASAVGQPLSTPMSSLTNDDLAKIASKIKQVEGWNPGQTEEA